MLLLWLKHVIARENPQALAFIDSPAEKLDYHIFSLYPRVVINILPQKAANITNS